MTAAKTSPFIHSPGVTSTNPYYVGVKDVECVVSHGSQFFSFSVLTTRRTRLLSGVSEVRIEEEEEEEAMCRISGTRWVNGGLKK